MNKLLILVILLFFLFVIPNALASKIYVISGAINNTVTIIDTPTLIGTDGSYQETPEGTSDYNLRIFSGTAETRRYHFDLYTQFSGGDENIYTFAITIPDSTIRIAVYNLNSELKSLSVSNSPPIVSSININQLTPTSYNLTWLASDLDNDNLTYSVYYSSDDISWPPYSINTQENSIVFSTSLLAEGIYKIKVIASDGFNTGEAISNTITIGQNPPIVSISSPIDNSIFTQGYPILFQGSAFSPSSGLLPDSSLTWTSSIDGIFSHNSSFYFENLSIGQHTITLTATDGSLSAFSQKHITITSQTSPDISLESLNISTQTPKPYNIFYLNAKIKNIITDALADIIVYDNSSVIYNSSYLFQPNAILNLNLQLNLSSGVHNLTLSVSNSEPSETNINNNELSLVASVFPDCKEADVDSDGSVSINDLSLFASKWGSQNYCGYEDMTGDMKVGIDDLSILASEWGFSLGQCRQRILSC